ncbi:hypothetical protein ACWD25_35975, partial [Streptomyces sp. NPDC002920]
MSDHALSRRTVLAIGLATGAVAAVGAGTAAAAPTPTADWFAAPAADRRPRFRWWWPDGLVDPDEIAREVDQIADAGFGGAEIAA